MKTKYTKRHYCYIVVKSAKEEKQIQKAIKWCRTRKLKFNEDFITTMFFSYLKMLKIIKE